MKSAVERFHEKWVEAANGCREWVACLNSKGYGLFSFGGPKKNVLAHRWAAQFLLGLETPKGMHVDHICNNRMCVNPHHLRVVSAKENIRAEHSNTTGGVFARRTHCQEGHPLSGENLRFRPDGSRRCLACHRARSKAVYWKKRDALRLEAVS